MDERVKKALFAKRESKYVEFKERFDVGSAQDWCEVIKDLVAIANSGGGILLFGRDNKGNPSGVDTTSLLELDPATIADKIYRYTETHFSDFQIFEAHKGSRKIVVWTIGRSPVPLVFTRPGTYTLPDGKQRTAFSAGTVYFRHGAKSAPGNTDDIRQSVDRRLEEIRQSWIGGVRKVVHAPPGAQVAILSSEVKYSDSPDAIGIRIVDDPSAPAYRTIDPDKTHPYRQKELVTEVNKRLHNHVINRHDIQAIKRVYKIDTNKDFTYKPKFGTTQYSNKFVNWIVVQYKNDERFFYKTREQFSQG